MRTTFAPPSTKAIDEPARPNDIREAFARTVTVFFHYRFGEKYLSPGSLLRSTAIFAAILGWLAWEKGLLVAGLPGKIGVTPLVTSVSLLSLVVAIIEKRWLLAAVFGLLVVDFNAPGGSKLILPIYRFAPSLADPTSLTSPKVIASIALFGATSVVTGAVRIWVARRFQAPHHLAVGRSILERWLRPDATNEVRWLLVLFVEPVVCAIVGAAVLLTFENWFGLYFMFTGLLMFDATLQRYTSAKSEVVTAASNIRHAEVRLEALDQSIIEPKDDAYGAENQHRGRGPVFVARPAQRDRNR